jgi:electron transfer flavoprotein-quinone oxidoreductase
MPGEKYEAVVVGAGPAGSAAGLELAKHGVQVLVLERGKEPGSKNVTGGILYGQTDTPYNLEHVAPDFERAAPLERSISRTIMHNVAGDKVASVDLTPLHLHRTKWAWSVLRARFDAWLAQRAHDEARKHSGGVLSNITVTGPLVQDGRIVGVESAELDPIKADLVIAADGATSELARKAGLWDWQPSGKWFQGVKVVTRMPGEVIEERFGVRGRDGVAHLFAGDLFGGVRGGGFLYTNKDTLSIGTVFHLDALEQAKTPPHELLDRQLRHPFVQDLLAGHLDELEYSAKLIPDGKKCMLREPWKDRMLAVGDAAGQLWASGPIIKGMNLGITAGILAAQSYVKAKEAGKPQQAGARYAQALRRSYVWRSTQAPPVKLLRSLAEAKALEGVARAMSLGRVRGARGLQNAQRLMNNPRLASAAPDTMLTYVDLPVALAQAHGQRVATKHHVEPRTLDDRIAGLKYDTAIGQPHIKLLDDRPAASGKAVHTCPVSSPGSSRGCYRLEQQKDDKGIATTFVAFDVQPCIECGTCAVEAKTSWTHPPGGKGVQYEWG